MAEEKLREAQMTPEDSIIRSYYDETAEYYDHSRFENTYGSFIHRQERSILLKEITNIQGVNVDLCCGTGRFMEFACYGVDASSKMVAQAKLKHGNKEFFVEDAANTHFGNECADTIFCFHVFMHLSETKTTEIIDEAHRILRPGGMFIFDFPSKSRRALFNKQKEGWHGASGYTIDEITKQAGEKLRIKTYYGVLFFPIHRLPSWLRKYFFHFDSILCRSIFKKYASYLVIVLVKK